jgi:hypothetical protein
VRIDSADDAKISILIWQALTTRASQLRALITTYGQEHGPVQVGDLTWGFVPKEKAVYPVLAVVKAIERAGIELGFKFVMSGSAVKPLLGRKYAQVHAALKELAQTRIETKFGPMSAAEESDPNMEEQ